MTRKQLIETVAREIMIDKNKSLIKLNARTLQHAKIAIETIERLGLLSHEEPIPTGSVRAKTY